jgi:hypothetical protein
MTGPQGNATAATITKEDESISVTSSYVNVFSFDIGNCADGVVVMRADVATNYRIYASAKSGTLPVDADESWTNILDTSATAADYSSTTSKLLGADKTFYESVSNKFRWFRVDMQTATTATAKIWFRGRNII